MLLRNGKMWLAKRYQGVSAASLTGVIDGITLGTSSSPPVENQVGVQGNEIYDTAGTYTNPLWSSATILMQKGSAQSPPFGDNNLVVKALLASYQLSDRPTVREIFLYANQARKNEGLTGTDPEDWKPGQTSPPWWPIARFIPTAFTIEQGDTLDLTWVLEFKDDLNA